VSSQSTSLTKIDRLMAALSVAERLTAESPVAPDSVAVTEHTAFGYIPGAFVWAIGVVLNMHRDPDGVRAFAEAFGVEVKAELWNDGSDVHTFADGVVGGVPFRAYALMEVTAEADGGSAVAA
jgi:hypothetical protein